MKTIQQTLILLISIVTFSQEKLVGKYCSTPIGESDVTCIDFKDNYQFEYEVSGCMGISSIGNGKFELKEKSLKLIFQKKEQALKSKIHIAENKSKSENEIKLEFNIKDKNGIKLPANIIRTSNRKYFFLDQENSSVLVEKDSPKANYRIECIGYETIDLELDSKTDKKIEVELILNQPLLITDKELNFELTEFNDKGFNTGTNPLLNKFRKVEN